MVASCYLSFLCLFGFSLKGIGEPYENMGSDL